MDIKIKYFGAVADVTGKSEERFPLESGHISLFDLKSELETIYPEIKNLHYSVAINQSMSTENTNMKANDELALLPPFAGG
jgi:molybdopterin synthase sulfur carrier subunit